MIRLITGRRSHYAEQLGNAEFTPSAGGGVGGQFTLRCRLQGQVAWVAQDHVKVDIPALPCARLGLVRMPPDPLMKVGDPVCISILCRPLGELEVIDARPGSCPQTGCMLNDPEECVPFYRSQVEAEIRPFAHIASKPPEAGGHGCPADSVARLQERAVLEGEQVTRECCRRGRDPGRCIEGGLRVAVGFFLRLLEAGFCKRDRPLSEECARLIREMECVWRFVGTTSPCEELARAIARVNAAIQRTRCRDRQVKAQARLLLEDIRGFWRNRNCSGEPESQGPLPSETSIPCPP